ncbi:endonuclease/exonuclease/phosphatase family protein [Fictibacillus norfolkensis]|uniref:Endonuclease/exonuclease/phosphatase family protein n=1 Tax=Fictibacillus norfolkensis TaxID=2762233 RepID=A0ABR8SN10_9BACL|nr:endonuclease/exonuclease/phosphatase family protein [Fictibacillus norfolkensis]MBD7964883.1 endonuclease/exonuclease/phosphatase family protein [Fictibacillus norfolkensis]
MKVMTFNIRVDIPGLQENAWGDRYKGVSQLINDESPVIVGMQEANESMIRDVMQNLSIYDWTGEPRRRGDEGTPIFYRTDLFTLLDSDTFWLSETPNEVGSMSWNTSYPRVCTWAELSLIEGPNTRFRVFNTHLDHMSEEARVQGIKLIGETIHRLNQTSHLPFLLMGDFNDVPSSKTFQYCEKELQLKKAFKTMGENIEDRLTFHDFKGDVQGEPIDFIFTSQDVMISQSKIIRTKMEHGYPSDHYPVTVEIELK